MKPPRRAGRSRWTRPEGVPRAQSGPIVANEYSSSPGVGPIRIGILGAARIAPMALLKPAQRIGIPVVSVAARDVEVARRYAAKHRIPRIHDSYQDLLDDPEIDAVYIPLPASLHAQWTIAAIAAGKHVLCEKPFTANAAQAEQVASVAARSDRVVMEAYHSGHHPLVQRLRDLLASEIVGEVIAARATFAVAIPPRKDIRWNPSLGGGALLDVGYYPVRMLRDLFGEPTVLSAQATERDGVDGAVTARLQFANGVLGYVECSMWPPRFAMPSLTIAGTLGTLRVRMPYHPQTSGRITFTSDDDRWAEKPDSTSTYLAQLRAFRESVLSRSPIRTDAPAAVRQMTTIDAIYQAAGMTPRCT
ncbi:Gfo/Idh/MocA family oxidoreductase [Microbacterium panaciterrae]